MKIRLFIFILILFQSILTIAQEPMVAYRKEGIWHYFDTNGKLMWQPYMDVASFPNGWCNGLLKAAAMDIKMDKTANIDLQRKQVLYDKKGKIVFQPKYDSLYRIITGFDKAEYIQLRDLDEDKVILCDKQGNIVYKAPTPYSHYLGDGVVEYIKNGEDTEGDKLHVLFDVKTKKPLAEVSCVGFLGNYAHGAVFTYNAKNHFGMYDRTGKELLPTIWNGNLLDDDEETILSTGFVALQDTATKKFTLFNKKGERVLTDIDEVVALKKEYFACEKTVDGDMQEQQFFLINGKAQKVEEQYGKIVGNTEGGILVCLSSEGDVILMDKTLKTIATIKDVNDFENIKVLKTHIWILTAKENFYDCYNEKGQKTGSSLADMVGNAAYNHVPFIQNGKWGLTHESGKIVLKPAFEFNSTEVPEVKNGYWETRTLLGDSKVRFDYYNFQGKLALSTTAEKDGWDYILQQETVAYFYLIY